MAACALSTMYCNVTGFSVGQGMASALDTLCSQSHTGARDKYALGKHLQRAIVVMFLISIPICILWINTSNLLLLAGQDPDISHLAGIYGIIRKFKIARYMIPGLLPYLINDCMRRYLQSQGIMKAPLYVLLMASPVNIFLQWLLVWNKHLSLGFIGAPIATSITNFLTPLLTMAYIKYVRGGSTWGGWSWKYALDIKQIMIFISLGIPGVIMLCTEW